MFKTEFQGFNLYSTGLSDGNLVDGLPSARHTEDVGGPHGVSGSAPICGKAFRK
jgi:hypothetical protein